MTESTEFPLVHEYRGATPEEAAAAYQRDGSAALAARYAEFPPALTPPPPGSPLAAPGVSRSMMIVLVILVALAILGGLAVLFTAGLAAGLPTY